jgi:aminopeptidase N
MRKKVIGGALLVLTFAALSSGASSVEPERLPSGVTPTHYDLALIPDAAHLTFRGRVQIDIDVTASTPAIVLNSEELTLDKAMLDSEQTASGIALDTKLQRATIAFPHPVSKGPHILAIDYHGVIGTATLGFFAMDYNSPAGKKRIIATNFEPASERRFMPSWDEPAFKATFDISVEAPANLMAVSNMPVSSTDNLPDGQKRVHFAVTPRMSTYLLFLGVGDFERIKSNVDGIDLGVIVKRGDTARGYFALNEASRLLHYYNQYFGVNYPLPKLDLIVAPGAIEGGSMENWGAIFYSQKHLLFDAHGTEADRQRVFMVVAHEMAHQWFGDLVTMSWWDNVWLNEGFARWMQYRAAKDLHKNWNADLQALANAEGGKRADAKPSTHPIVQPVLNASQAEQAFDDITYNKGAAVIGMLEAYVGPEAFRDGVRGYMKAHAYGNTVDADLWREVQAVAKKAVLDVEADFTRQPGVPLLRVESGRTRDAGTEVVLSVGRFAEDPSTIASAPAPSWRIPVGMTAGGDPTIQLLSGSDATKLTVPGTGPVIVNAGQSSYARTLYPPAMIQALSAGMAAAKPVDQLGVLNDAWALGQSGYQPITDYLDLTGNIPLDADALVWRQIVSTLLSLDKLYEGKPRHQAFAAYAREKLHPLVIRLGWDAKQKEEPNTAPLREAVLIAMSRFGYQPVIAEAQRRFDAAVLHPEGTSPNVQRTALSIVARHADAKTLDRLLAMLKASEDPLEKQNVLEALADVADSSGAERVLEFAVGPDAPAGTVDTIILEVATSHPDLAWKFALSHVDQPGFPLASSTRLILMPRIASYSNDPKRAADLKKYADEHISASARQNVEAAISAINLSVKFRAERIPAIDAWVAKYAAAQ